MSKGSVGIVFCVREGGQLRMQIGGIPEQQQYWPISSGGLGTPARRAKAIKLAIAVAQREGDITSILLPNQIFPYDASLVTFDSAIRMLREGQIWDITDIKAYGAVGDGVNNDTAAIQAAFTPGGAVIIPDGTYLTDQVTGADNLVVTGSGKRTAVFKARTGGAGLSIVNLDNCEHVKITSLGFDGASHATIISGVRGSAGDDIEISGCWFKDFRTVSSYSGPVSFTATSNLRIHSNDVDDSGQAIAIENGDSRTWIQNNRVKNTIATLMRYGIRVEHSATVDAEVQITGNYVEGANYDPSAIGVQGWGIFSARHRGVNVSGNTVVGCGATTTGGGILFSGDSHDGSCDNNRVRGSLGTGIFIELEIDNDTTIGAGTGEPRGMGVTNNRVSGSSSSGINLSFSPACNVDGNICHDNAGFGINWDSDRTNIGSNVCYNNAGDAGLQASSGSKSNVIGNQAFDNKSSKAQNYGVSIATGTGHQLVGNQVDDNQTSGYVAGQLDARIGLLADKDKFALGNAGHAITQILTNTALWNPTDLADGAVDAQNVTVTGVAAGDPIQASFTLGSTNNILISAHVSAADTVRVVLMNKTGGNLNLAEGTLRVTAFKY